MNGFGQGPNGNEGLQEHQGVSVRVKQHLLCHSVYVRQASKVPSLDLGGV